MDFLIVADVFSKYFLVRKLTNSSSAAVCAEIATIVTELGLPHVIRSDNGPCYNSKEFQQKLQRYNITHQTSSPHHPRSNGFVERMVGVAKKLMNKAESEGKPWISGLYEYRVTPQSGSIASPLQLITQRTPREKDLPQSPSTQYTPREKAQDLPLLPDVRHPQPPDASEPQKLKGPTQTQWHPTPEYSHLTENQKAKFHSPYISNEERNLVRHNSVNKIPSNLVIQTKSSTASVSDSVFSERKEEIAEIAEDAPAEDAPKPAPAPAPASTLERVKEQPHTPGTRKSTRRNFGKPASAYSDFYM